jgi:hypothetical protein
MAVDSGHSPSQALPWLKTVSAGVNVTVHGGSCDRYSKFNDYSELLEQTCLFLFLSSAMADGRFCERLVVSTPSFAAQNFSPLKGGRRLEHQGG